jgi:hypothetical protein
MQAQVYAEGGLTDASQLLGQWNLEGTAIKIDGEKTPERGKWVFESGGKLTVTSFYKFAGGLGEDGKEYTMSDTYSVEDGKFVSKMRGKFEVIEKQDNAMIFKGTDGVFYFFKKP